jgi:hypothetical protein
MRHAETPKEQKGFGFMDEHPAHAETPEAGAWGKAYEGREVKIRKEIPTHFALFPVIGKDVKGGVVTLWKDPAGATHVGVKFEVEFKEEQRETTFTHEVQSEEELLDAFEILPRHEWA